MTDQSKRVSEFSIATNITGDDRFLILDDPSGSPSIKTVNVAIVVANIGSVGSYVNTQQLSANLSQYQTKTGLEAAIAPFTVNNAIHFNGVSSVDFVTASQLSANVATRLSITDFNSNIANYPTKTQLTDNLARYQTSAGLAANVVKLSANNAAYLNGLSAFEYVNNVTLSTTLANYVTIDRLNSNLALYQTRAGLASNVVTLTSNSTNFVGTIPAANVVSDSTLTTRLGPYFVTAGLSDNVARLSANNSAHLGGLAAVYYVNTAQLSANLSNYVTISSLQNRVLGLTANNSLYLGGIPASGYVTTASLNLTPYLRIEDLANNVLGLQANASYFVVNHPDTSIKGYVNTASATISGNVSVGNELLLNGGFGSPAPTYGVRAWATFNGRPGNIYWWWWWWFLAVTENDEGDYTLTFRTPMPDTNYAVLGNADVDRVNIWFWNLYPGPANIDVYDRTTTSVSFRIVGGWWFGYLLRYSPAKVSVAVIR